MKKLIFTLSLLLGTVAIGQISSRMATKQLNNMELEKANLITPITPFSAYASCWAFNKSCEPRMWLNSAENILKQKGLTVFDVANDNNISVAGYNASARVLVTVVCVPSPNGTTMILNVFSDDENVIKTKGELFRAAFKGVTTIDGC